MDKVQKYNSFKYSLGDHIEEDEMRTFTHERDGKCKQNFGQKGKGRNHLEDTGVDGRIILR
jgi:hypothetical protein